MLGKNSLFSRSLTRRLLATDSLSRLSHLRPFTLLLKVTTSLLGNAHADMDAAVGPLTERWWRKEKGNFFVV